MLKKVSTMIAVALMVASMTAFALAADILKGKVTKVEGDKITVTIEGAVPAWVKTGATVTAASAAPRVLSVKGSEVTLTFSKARAAKIKVDANMSLSEFTGYELQGC
ncbi:MAG: selenite/tellurite reduction operon protein ExtJ [Syntrophales bacterium]|nr:selenite/tellurite reduction operon protein ExtJ [Syntrophales bacterium]